MSEPRSGCSHQSAVTNSGHMPKEYLYTVKIVNIGNVLKEYCKKPQ